MKRTNWNEAAAVVVMFLVAFVVPAFLSAQGAGQAKPAAPVAKAAEAGPAPDAKLTEVEQLKAQLHTTKLALAQVEYKLAQAQAQVNLMQLQAERQQLDQALTRPGYVMDWDTLTLKKADPPKAADSPKK